MKTLYAILITLFFTISLIFSVPGLDPFIVFIITPLILFYCFCRLIITMTGKSKRELKELNDMYQRPFIFIRNLIIKIFTPFKYIVPSIDAFLNKWVLGWVKFIIQSVTKAIEFFPKTILYVSKSILEPIYKGIVAVRDYIFNLADWIVNKSADYVIAVVTFMFNFFFFQIQEILNSFLSSAFKLFKFPKFEVIDMDQRFFILK